MDLRALIQEHNPQWAGGATTAPQDFRRDAVAKLTETLLAQSVTPGTRRAQVLTGLRRAGKTTVLRQVISALVEQGVPASSTLYFELDDLRARGATIEEVLEASGFEGSWSAERPRFLLLDEVGHDPNWTQTIKRLADLREKAPCVVVTDSVASILKPSEGGESAVGRRFDRTLEPMSFSEVARLRNLLVEDPRDADGPALSLEADRYLLRGGMPGVVFKPGPGLEIDYALLRLDAERILADAPRVREIRHPEKLRLLWSILSQNPAIALNTSSLSKQLETARPTIDQMVDTIRELLLIRELPAFGGGPLAQVRNAPKFLVSDSGIAAAHLGLQERESDQVRGHLVEVAILRHLVELASPPQDARLGYARGLNAAGATGAEADFVLERADFGRVAVEAKYGLLAEDLRSLKKLGQIAFSIKAERAILVSRSPRPIRHRVGDREVLAVPLWVFLLWPERALRGEIGA